MKLNPLVDLKQEICYHALIGCLVLFYGISTLFGSALLNTQHYKVRIKGKVEHPPLLLGVAAIEKGSFKSPLTNVN